MKKQIICILLAILLAMTTAPALSEDVQSYSLGEEGLLLMKAYSESVEKAQFNSDSNIRALFAVCAFCALGEVGAIDSDDGTVAFLGGNMYVASLNGENEYYFVLFTDDQTVILCCPQNSKQINDCRYYLFSPILASYSSATVMDASFSDYWTISFLEFDAMLEVLNSIINPAN